MSDEAITDGAPEGWVLVPREPTEEMTTAGLRAWFGDDGPFFTAAKSLQRRFMADAIRAALAKAHPQGGE